MGDTLNLGEDPTLTGGITATGEMLDENPGPQENTNFIVKVTNHSATAVPNYRLFVQRIAGAVNVFPDHVHCVTLGPGETEECIFLVQNPTSAVQTNYKFRVRSQYGFVTHNYANFVRP